MKTVKLYDLDSHQSVFEAMVLSCEKRENRFSVVLDKTAFFPEGGGQPSDIGTLDGVNVLDVQIENDTIYHYTDAPVEIGAVVCGRLDFERRFRFMQNHSGEHIVSGIVNSLYGLDNVGFHLNEELVTLDFNGILSPEQILLVEQEANRRVWQNVKFNTYYPTTDELEKLEYRSKKELDGDIRIVEIEGTDRCACCAPHVNVAGEIGMIKLLDTEKMRGGSRIVMKCGQYALDDYNTKYQNVRKISELLSSKQENSAEAVLSLSDKLSDEKHKCTELQKRIAELLVDTATADTCCIFAEGLDRKELQLIADRLCKTYGGVRAVFSPCEDGFAFSICGDDTLDSIFADFKAKFTVRGGGRNGMVQGTVTGDKTAIKSFFSFG